MFLFVCFVCLFFQVLRESGERSASRSPRRLETSPPTATTGTWALSVFVLFIILLLLVLVASLSISQVKYLHTGSFPPIGYYWSVGCLEYMFKVQLIRLSLRIIIKSLILSRVIVATQARLRLWPPQARSSQAKSNKPLMCHERHLHHYRLGLAPR